MTTLLFPFVHCVLVEQQEPRGFPKGIDTGIVITNALAEPFGKPQAGTCDVHFFGKIEGGGLAPLTISARVEPGEQYRFSLLYVTKVLEDERLVRKGFTGYLVVECSFDDAYGFANVYNYEPLPRSQKPEFQALSYGYLAQRITNRVRP